MLEVAEDLNADVAAEDRALGKWSRRGGRKEMNTGERTFSLASSLMASHVERGAQCSVQKRCSVSLNPMVAATSSRKRSKVEGSGISLASSSLSALRRTTVELNGS